MLAGARGLLGLNPRSKSIIFSHIIREVWKNHALQNGLIPAFGLSSVEWGAYYIFLSTLICKIKKC